MRRAAMENTPFFKRRNGTQRAFGGYNLFILADWWQLPPIPDSGALFRPPNTKPAPGSKSMSQGVKNMLNAC